MTEHGAGRTLPPEGVFIDIAASELRTCGVREGGELECWGDPWRFDGREVLPSGPFVKVSLGDGRPHSEADGEYGCAIRADGSLVCWLSQNTADTAAWAASWTQVPFGRFVDVSAQFVMAAVLAGLEECR